MDDKVLETALTHDTAARAYVEPARHRDLIIRDIMGLMERGEWHNGRSHRDFAEREGVKLATVRSWSSEAALVLRQCRGDPEDIRDEIINGIRRVGEAALARKREAVTQKGEVFELSDPDCRTALQALVEIAILSGVREERTHQRVDVTAMSEAEIMKQLEEQGYVVRRAGDIEAPGEEKK